MEEKDKGNQVITEEGSDPEVTDGIYEPDGDEEQDYYRDEVALPTPKTVARASKAFNEDGTIRRIIKAPKSSFVSTLIYLDGKPFDFTGREYLFPIYNRNSSRILLKTSRQVEKTTFLANNLTVDSLVINYNKSLYVSPSHTQTRQFSNEKLRPAIEKSPFVKKYFQDHSVSTQVFEKGFTNGSYVFLRSAFRSADRCVVRGTRITLADGSTKLVENLREGDLLLSTPGGKGLTKRPCRAVWSNGVKPTVRVVLQSGQEVIASENHRWLTNKGIVQSTDLQGKWVPIPLGFFSPKEPGDETYDLLGMFLGDGCMAQNGKYSSYETSFNNNDLEVIAHFEEISRELGLETRRLVREQSDKLNYTVKFEKESHEKVKKILRDFGVLGKIWSDRFIPECVFGSPDRARRVLRGMFESDGWVTFSSKTKQCEVGWVSGSLQLARDVQYCLQGLGVYSTLQIKPPSGRQKSTSYNIKVRSVEYIKAFSDSVGFISSRKQAILAELLSFTIDNMASVNTSIDVPAREDVNLALTEAGISDHSLWSQHKISWRKNSTVNGERVSLQKVRKIHELTKSSHLLKYLSPDVSWVKIESLETNGLKEVFDLSVEVDEVFSANGVFTHNTRGISARNLALDELQDFLGSEIPVIMECTSHFPDARVLMAGTPKSHDNPIQTYWEETTQNEWLVPCSCGKWNFLDDANIGPTEHYRNGRLPPGPVCKKCGKPINVRSGQWMSTSPGKLIEGYRVPQLMVPWIIGLTDQWERLLWKRDNYPIGQLYNEVLGLSYDSASKPITRDEIIEICDSYDLWDGSNLTPTMIAESKKFILTAGVDWGEGNDGSEKSPSGKIRNASYTVLTIGAYINQKQYAVKLIKKYEGREVDPDFVVKDIARICGALGVRLIGVDWGHGWGVNNHLSRLYGGNKVVQFQYLPKLKHRMKWDPIGYRYHLQRNFMMSELFFDMKNGLVRFPRWAQMERFAKDILGIYAEYVEFRREMKYDHKPTDPDDFFHSLHYSKLAADIHLGKSRKYTVDVVQGNA